MPKLTPAQATEKHARNLIASIEDMRIGVEAMTEAPGVAAADAQTKMKQNLVAAIDSGKWANNVKAVSLEDWKTAYLDKGLGRVATGIEGAADKVEDFFSQLFPYQETLQRTVDAMPDVTLEDSIQRMTSWVRGMAKFEKK